MSSYGGINAPELLQLIENKRVFFGPEFLPLHGIMEYWNVGLNKGMIYI
jgi:hypothetical protein